MAAYCGVVMIEAMDTDIAITSSVPAAPGGRPAASDGGTAPPKQRYVAMWWALLFAAIHLYWATGQNFGISTAGNTNKSVSFAVFVAYDLFIVVLLLIGAAIAATLLRPDWQRRYPRWMLRTGAWIATVLLLLRGGLGLLEDVLRGIGLLPHGFFGMSNEDLFGTAHPSAAMLWSSIAIEAYFLLGGIMFAVTLRSYYRRATFQS